MKIRNNKPETLSNGSLMLKTTQNMSFKGTQVKINCFLKSINDGYKPQNSETNVRIQSYNIFSATLKKTKGKVLGNLFHVSNPFVESLHLERISTKFFQSQNQ